MQKLIKSQSLKFLAWCAILLTTSLNFSHSNSKSTQYFHADNDSIFNLENQNATQELLNLHALSTGLPLFIYIQKKSDEINLEEIKENAIYSQDSMLLESSSILLIHSDSKKVIFEQNHKITALVNEENKTLEVLREKLEKSLYSSAENQRSAMIDFITAFLTLTESPVLLENKKIWTTQEPAISENTNPIPIITQEPTQFHNFKINTVYFSLNLSLILFLTVLFLRIPTFTYINGHSTTTFQVKDLILVLLFLKSKKQNEEAYESVSTTITTQ